MKNLKRILLIVLACVMTLSCFVGCKKDEEEGGGTTGATAATVAEPGPYDSELPADLNYGDEVITIISRDVIGQSDEFYSTGEDGANIVSNAVYTRNQAVAGRLGVKLDVIPVVDDTTNAHATVIAKVSSDITSGSGEYDIITAPAYTALAKVTEGLFYNLRDVENLNLDKYYWAQGFNEFGTVGSAQYLATGMVSLSLYRFMYVTVYNNAIFEERDLESIYDKVKNNTWTMEEQYQMTSKLYIDDGDESGVYDEKDTYGFVSGARTSVDAYLASANVEIIGKDSEGYYTYVGTQEKLSGLADKIIKLFYTNEGAYIIPTGRDNTDNADIADMFAGKKVAMASMKVQALEEKLRKLEFEYSIAPLPKYDANQENYGTLVQDQVTIMALPMTVTEDNRAMLGAVMECFAAESYKNTYSAYFETALSYQYLQNQESLEMLKIIYESIDFAPLLSAYATDVGWNTMLRNVAGQKYNSISFQFASTAKNVQTKVDEVNQKYRDLLAG
ncbi:MAG: hypothetical protein IJ038_07280 [Clostridia bacterium]|nr:hypothetical protein [Clostridia bacterium]